jgi:epoxyqueuosine reductase
VAAGVRSLAADLKQVALDAGLDAVGIAPATPFTSARRVLEERKAAGLHGGMEFTYRNPARSTDPQRALPGAQAMVVGARRYRRDAASVASPVTAARVAAYSWTDHYEPVRAALSAVADTLHAAGWRTRVLVDDNALVDREAAHRAGLGWFGKNTNVLVPGLGSWVVFGTLLTDAPLPPDSGPVDDGCGACTRCLPACPTGALVAPGVLDARRCLAWLLEAPGDFPLEFRDALGDRIYGCDDCQDVCPPNKTADRHRPPARVAPSAQPWVDVVAMLEMDDAALMARFGRWYISERDPRYVRRNALVVLGNVGDPAAPDVRRVVGHALASPDPMLREHAEWAAAKLGLARTAAG